MATATAKKPNWFVVFITSTIGRKLIMALTGLFLILFLVVHLIGNLQLLIPDGGKTFNEYAHFMGHNKFIQAISIGNFFFIVLHIIVAIVLTRQNTDARPVGYAYPRNENKSSWASRQMMLLGTIVLIFLVVHLQAFWAKSKFGSLPDVTYGNGEPMHNLYIATVIAFSEWWIVLLYVLSMIGLAFHLSHGFASAFQTLGLNHKKYTPLITALGTGFSIIVPFLYALIPVVMFLQQLSK